MLIYAQCKAWCGLKVDNLLLPWHKRKFSGRIRLGSYFKQHYDWTLFPTRRCSVQRDFLIRIWPEVQNDSVYSKDVTYNQEPFDKISSARIRKLNIMYYSIRKGDRLGYSRVKSWFMDIRAIARMAHCSGAGGRQGADTLQFSEQRHPYKAIKSMTVTCSEYDTGIVNSSHCTGNSRNFKPSSSSFNPNDIS